eukprot:TRINITY_DN12030_c0_g2_i11.p3 TRINITY_DN12030_c0_g2~~TRINITY_DN12030_c0_g2_i11.p3  ORF type:complete len:156 (+),score=19.07 TRINITY_DN12030_c0_g2_i11:981-1448(+)
MDLWQPEQTLTALKDALACGKALDCTEDELNAFQAAICSIAARWERQPNAEPFEHHHRVVILDTWATIYDIVAQIDMKQGERLLMILGRWPAVKTDLTLILGDERIFMRLLKFQLFKVMLTCNCTSKYLDVGCAADPRRASQKARGNCPIVGIRS